MHQLDLDRGAVRLEAEALAVRGNRLIHLPTAPKGNAEVVVGRGQIRPEAEALPVLGNGLINMSI